MHRIPPAFLYGMALLAPGSHNFKGLYEMVAFSISMFWEPNKANSVMTQKHLNSSKDVTVWHRRALPLLCEVFIKYNKLSYAVWNF